MMELWGVSEWVGRLGSRLLGTELGLGLGTRLRVRLGHGGEQKGLGGTQMRPVVSTAGEPKDGVQAGCA